MLKTILALALPILLLWGNSIEKSGASLNPQSTEGQTGTLEKMIVADGSVAMDIDLKRLNGSSRTSAVRFDVVSNSFFPIVVFNNELRSVDLGSMALTPKGWANLPPALSASFNQLSIDKSSWIDSFELSVRDSKTSFPFFNLEGLIYEYEAKAKSLNITGRLLISPEFAAKLGRASAAGSVAGKISITVTMRPIEVTQVVDGQASSVVMPAATNAGTRPGPDVIVGDITALQQFGSAGTQVGLAIGTDSCNNGQVDLNWFALPANDHPVIPQNVYRQSGGATNNERFEQIGQSNVKHAFTALTQNICGFGCNGVGGSRLGSGCSDPYSASLNSGPSLGSRAWINPFTGAYPRGDSATPPNTHTGHSHSGTSHRVVVEAADLNTTLNPGAQYFAEGQYITPHEYAWCQANPGQCNMYNNVSYRRYNVSGTTSFTFSSVGATVRMSPAIKAWFGATVTQFEPDPGNDGIGFIGFKVTNSSPGIWHYEYAIYNQNLDRAIQSFSVPVGAGVNVTNLGFHAPPQQPGWNADGTLLNQGYSSAPWAVNQAPGSLTWSSETFAQNQNANAIRWGTLYNVRFDADSAPVTTNATIGFYKTGAPITVEVQGPSPANSTITFSGASFTASEGDGSATITVNRGGNTAVAVTVDYASNDGSAHQNRDYTSTSGTLNFAGGETSKTFSVPIIENVFVDGSRTVNLGFSNPTGGAQLGAPNSATLTINDNDAGGPTIIINGQPVNRRRFFAQMSGAQETPSNGSAGNGSAIVLLNSNESSALTGVKFSGLGSAQTAAHIHTGPIGVAGPVTFPLPTAGTVTDFGIAPAAGQVTDLKAGQHYVNIHSSSLPNGEIRGQLLWNPTLEDPFFVRQHFLDFLNREPDSGGLAFWLSQLHCPQGVTGDQADVQCFHDRTVGVSNAFYFSDEFQKTASFVFLGYRAAYGNTQPFPNPDQSNPAESSKLPDYKVFGADRPKVLGGVNLAQQQLTFATQFVGRNEFTNRYGAGLNTGPLFVDAVLANILASDGVAFSPADRTTLINHYDNAGGGNAGRAMVMWHLSNDYWNTCGGPGPCVPAGFGAAVDTRAFIDANYNRFFALVLYFGYLRRNPDIGGFLFWQNKINEAPVRNVPKQNSLVCSFMTSGEYQDRFGPGTAFGPGFLWPRTNAECPP